MFCSFSAVLIALIVLALGRDLTAAFVTELEEGLTIALGYNDTLQGTIIH